MKHLFSLTILIVVLGLLILRGADTPKISFSIQEQEEFFFLQAKAQDAQLQAEHSKEYEELRAAQKKVEDLQKLFEETPQAKEMRTSLKKFQDLVEDRRKKCSAASLVLQASPEGKPTCSPKPPETKTQTK